MEQTAVGTNEVPQTGNYQWKPSRKFTYRVKDMLIALLDHSDNEISKMIARKILTGTSSIEVERTKGHPVFMLSVLNGRYTEAVEYATGANRVALLQMKEDGYEQIDTTQED